MPQCLATLCSFCSYCVVNFPTSQRWNLFSFKTKEFPDYNDLDAKGFKLTFLGRNPNAEAVKYQVLIEPAKKERKEKELIIMEALNCVYVYNFFMYKFEGNYFDSNISGN